MIRLFILLTLLKIQFIIGYTLGGNISGLPNGSTLSLMDNANNSISNINKNGSFTINEIFGNRASLYDVKLLTTKFKNATCTITNSRGILYLTNINNINIICLPIYPMGRPFAASWMDPYGNEYIYGGTTYASGPSSSDLWKWDGESWKEIFPKTPDAQWPGSLTTAATWTDNDNAYLYGGYKSLFYVNTLWIYNFASQTWRSIHPNFPFWLSPGSAWSMKINDIIYGFVLVWETGTTNTNIYKYDPTTESFTKLSNGSFPNNIQFFQARSYVTSDNKVYIYYNTSGLSNSLWRWDPNSTNLPTLVPTSTPWPSTFYSPTSWLDNSGNFYVLGATSNLVELWMYNGNSWVQIQPVNGQLWPSNIGANPPAWTDKNSGYSYVFGADVNTSIIWKFNNSAINPQWTIVNNNLSF